MNILKYFILSMCAMCVSCSEDKPASKVIHFGAYSIPREDVLGAVPLPGSVVAASDNSVASIPIKIVSTTLRKSIYLSLFDIKSVSDRHANELALQELAMSKKTPEYLPQIGFYRLCEEDGCAYWTLLTEATPPKNLDDKWYMGSCFKVGGLKASCRIGAPAGDLYYEMSIDEADLSLFKNLHQEIISKLAGWRT